MTAKFYPAFLFPLGILTLYTKQSLDFSVLKIDLLNVWYSISFSKVFHLYSGGQCIYSCFPGVLVTSTSHNILSKPLAAFPHNHCRNNGQQ